MYVVYVLNVVEEWSGDRDGVSLSDSRWFHKEAAAGKSFSVHVYLDTRLDAFEGARECAKITRNNHKLFLDHVYLEVLLDVSFLFGNTWLTLGSISKVDKFSDRASSQYKASNIRFTSNSDELPDEFKVEPSRLIWPLSSAECRKSVSNRSPLKICLRSVSTKIERQRSVLRSQPCHFDIFSGCSSHGNGVLGIVEDLQAEQFCKLNNWRERWGGCMPAENIVTSAS